MVKKLLQVAGFSFLLIFGVGGYFASCANVNGPNSSNPDSNVNKGKDLSINMNNLTGLAIGDGASVAKSAARSATSEGMLLKILDDGSVENFFNLPEGASLAPVSFITQSTSENAKEIYVVFQYESYWWDNDGYHRIGQLLCIYEDGSYVDIMQTNDGTWKTLANRGNQDSPIRFDGNGNMYYLVEESTNNNWLHMIYKFNPKTGVSEQLVGQIPNTYYDEFYVSKDGLWLFAKANRWQENGSSVSYLRAIPTTDVNNPVNLFYDSTGSSWVNEWIYDENSKNVYYIQGDAFYKIPYKDGTYDKGNKELLYGNDYNNSNNNYNVGYIWWDTLLKNDYVDGVNNSTYTINGRSDNQQYDLNGSDYSTRYYYFISKETEEIDYKEIVDYYFVLLLDYINDRWTYEDGYSKPKNYRNEYEIRFDEFANVKGFEKLATETKDKDGNSLVDEELFKAIVEKDLLGLLYELIYSERYTTKTTWNTYKNNFFADVLYQKESKEKINTELFNKDETGFSYYWEWALANFIKVDNEWQEGEYFYTWKDEFLDETTGKVVAQKVLDKLAACCGKDAIDFSLAYFENLEGYEGLYTDAKNEEAIAFLDSKEKLQLLCDFFNDPNITDRSSLFLSNTCFVPGTDTPAWNNYSSNNDNSFWIGSINKLILCGTSLYGLSYENKVVHLIDEQGEPIMRCVNIDYTDPIKIASANVYGNGFYIQNAVVNAAGEEEGAHVILRYDFVSEQIENMFYNIPNNKSYEVISYTVGGDNLYCCLSKGIEISTWKINIATKEITKIESSSKLTQIIVVK